MFHSGIAITLVPLDATNTIPVNEEFFYAFQQQQSTYEAQYCFDSLKMARDTWFNDEFYTVSYMLISLDLMFGTIWEPVHFYLIIIFLFC